MPQNPAIVAAKTTSAHYILDCSKQAEEENEEAFNPYMTLGDSHGEGRVRAVLEPHEIRLPSVCYSQENYVVMRHFFRDSTPEEMRLRLSSGNKINDGTCLNVLIDDYVSSASVTIMQGQIETIRDVTWSYWNEGVFASCVRSGDITIWDTRLESEQWPLWYRAHAGEVK